MKRFIQATYAVNNRLPSVLAVTSLSLSPRTRNKMKMSSFHRKKTIHFYIVPIHIPTSPYFFCAHQIGEGVSERVSE